VQTGRVAGAVPQTTGFAVDARQKKLMSRAAELSALALHELFATAGWTDRREAIGCYAGVGASGGDLGEVRALLGAASDGETLSMERFGREGLAACTPLLAFQLMNNFVLAHAAIQERVGGPNAAFFSRGAGTTMALCEALAALGEGDCERAVAGGADDALHEVTRAELVREGHDGPLAEGAAYLGLARDGAGALARVQASVRPRAWDADVVLRVEEVAGALGQALAATPALAWAAAVDLIVAGAPRVAVVGRGLDGDVGTVLFSAVAP